MKEIKLSQQGKHRGKYVALVDDEDFERVNQFRWSVLICKHTEYALRTFFENGKKRYQLLHVFILGIEDKRQVDHVDHIGLNCQRYNMRACTRSQNFGNSQPRTGCSSKYKGVHWFKKANKWTAYICVNKKTHYLGYFHDETDAAKAYDIKAKELFGEYSFCNFHD